MTIYPLDPVYAIARARWRQPNTEVGVAYSDVIKIAVAADVNRQTVRRWINAGGLTSRQADHCAVRLGYHPAELWPEWWHKEAAA
jgi:hypothetical protein